jgi:TonB family protein
VVDKDGNPVPDALLFQQRKPKETRSGLPTTRVPIDSTASFVLSSGAQLELLLMILHKGSSSYENREHLSTAASVFERDIDTTYTFRAQSDNRNLRLEVEEAPQALDNFISGGVGDVALADTAVGMATFDTGTHSFMQWASKNVRYPTQALERRMEGRSVGVFTVAADGSVRDIRVLSGNRQIFDNEVQRLLRSMPPWVSAEGARVADVTYKLPVSFTLEGSTKALVMFHNLEIDSIHSVKSSGDAVVQPEFPGGQEALMTWLSNNIRYPIVAIRNGMSGRVLVEFVVNRDGSLSDIRTLGPVQYKPFNEEAIRVVSKMPPWTPGMLNGKPVRVRYTLPVHFRTQPK